MKYSFLDIRSITTDELEYWYSIMSDEKRHYVSKYIHADDRIRSICGEILARKEISAYCGVIAEKIIFSKNESGKPVVINIPVEFNISHSGDMVACVVSGKSVGIDIEKIGRIDIKTAGFFCTEKDMEYFLHETDAEVRNRRLYEIWTAKEAAAKCFGTDLDHLKSIDFYEIRKTGTRIDFHNYTSFAIEA